MVNGKKLLASVLVGAMVITGSPVAPAWSVASVEAAEAHEHNYVKSEEYWNSSNTSVTVEYACSLCDATKTITSNRVLVKETKTATCEAGGEKYYIASYISGKDANDDDVYTELTRKLKEKTDPLTYHNYSKSVEDPSNWSFKKGGTVGYTGTVAVTCSDCGFKDTLNVKVSKEGPTTVSCQKVTKYSASIDLEDGKNYKYPDAKKTGVFKTVQEDDHSKAISDFSLAWVEPTEAELNGTPKNTLSYVITATCYDCGKTYVYSTNTKTADEDLAATCIKGAIRKYNKFDEELTIRVKNGASYYETTKTVSLPAKTVEYKTLGRHILEDGVVPESLYMKDADGNFIVDSNRNYVYKEKSTTCKDKTYTGKCKYCQATNVTVKFPADPTKHTKATGATETYIDATCTTVAQKVYSKCEYCGKENVAVPNGTELASHEYQIKIDDTLDDPTKVKLVDLSCEKCNVDLGDNINNKVEDINDIPTNANSITCQQVLRCDLSKDITGLSTNLTGVTVLDNNGKKVYGSHNYNQMSYTWAENTTTPKVLVTFKCANSTTNNKCDVHTVTVKGNITGQGSSADPCTAGARVNVTATFKPDFENVAYSSLAGDNVTVDNENKKITITDSVTTAPLGHDYVEPGETYNNEKAEAVWGDSQIKIPCKRCDHFELVNGKIKNVATDVKQISGTFTLNGKTYTISESATRTNFDNTTKITGLKSEGYEYTGKAQIPDVTVTHGSGTPKTTLKKDIDYTVDVKNNINVGKATITVTGIGKYYGTVTETFEINKATLKIIPSGTSKTYGNKDNIGYTIKNGEEIVVSNNDVKAEIKREEGETVGTYKGTITIAETDNFKAVSTDFSFTIAPRGATINIQNASKVAGAADPKFVYTTENVVPGDDLNVAITRDAGETVGEYVIHATFNNANYNVNIKTGTLTIKAAPAPAPKAQSITTKKLTANYKVAAVKKAAKTFSIGATCTSKKAVTAKKVSGSKKITVSSTGKVKIAKGTKKGTYTAKVKLTAPKTSSYKVATKTVKVTVKVK